MRLPALLAFALLLSGCAAGDAATDDAATDAGRESDGGAADVVPTEAVAVDFTGDIGPAFCTRGLPAQVACIDSSPSPPPGIGLERTYLADAYAGPLAARLSVAWDAATPATQELRVQWGVFVDCATRCLLDRVSGDVTQASPVDIAVSPLLLKDGERFGVYVHHSADAGPAELEASLTQAFTVSGELFVVPSA